ncbi:MAG: M48 family metalloprotease [Treponema sp.]|jgi:predicted Zn-dependent protease|nr:M48 family metalloprotease [Treponema sp.]
MMRGQVKTFLFICFLLPAIAIWGQGCATVSTEDAVNAVKKDPQGAVNAMNEALNRMEKLQQGSSPEDDYYLGRAVAANILAMPDYQAYTANADLTAYVNKICQALVINSSSPSSFNGYHVMLLNSQEYNAFATPGGHIMLTKTLVEAAASEDALAALIAHELSHIILRHAAEIIQGVELTSQMGDLANKALDMSGSSAAQRTQALRQLLSPVLDTIVKNGFSQSQEYEADNKALELLDAAGYDPKGLLDMLQVLQQVQGSKSGGFNKTHPSPRDRIANVNRSIGKYQANTTQSYRAQRFKVK